MQKKTEYVKVASYEAKRGEVKKVVLLYSGGLDTSIMLKWIQDEYKAEVITLTIDIGQLTDDLEEVRKKALKLGAIKAIVIDAKDEFANEYIAKGIRANASYQGKYHLSTPLGRPLLAKWAVKIAMQEGADAIAHGSNGHDNDQVRLEGSILALNPDVKIINPLRETNMSKEELIAYAKENNIPFKQTLEKPYSSDDNMWGITSEGGEIDNPATIPSLKEILLTCSLAENAPDKPELVQIEFVKGLPVGVNGKQQNLTEIIVELNKIGAKHGVGVVQSIEDTIVGLKTRGVYEAPAAEIIICAHEKLEKYVSTKAENEFKEIVDEKWAYLCYGALWLEPLMDNLDAYIEKSNQKVTGKVTVKLYKGWAEVVALETPNTIFEEKLATFVSWNAFNQNASAGFIELYTLQMRLAQRAEKTVLLSLGKRQDKITMLSAVKKLHELGYILYSTYKTHKFLKKHGITSLEVNKISQPHLKPNLADLLEANRFDLIINISAGKQTVTQKEKSDGEIIREKAVAGNIPLVTSIKVAEQLIDRLYNSKL